MEIHWWVTIINNIIPAEVGTAESLNLLILNRRLNAIDFKD